jgi:hypothetical protein
MGAGFASTAATSGRGRRLLKRLALAAPLAALSLTAAASPAAASVRIGQLAPPSSPPDCGTVAVDRAQPTVTSGNSYVVPGAGTITSWSHEAGTNPGQTMTMKVFRKVAEPARYMVVGHDGPHPLTAAALNVFPVSIAVEPGDVLGLNAFSPAAANTCYFGPLPGESHLDRIGDLADGVSGDFTTFSDFRLNIQAVFEPSNSFTFGKIKLNKKKGTAIIASRVPNPGQLIVEGKSLRRVTETASTPGNVKLLIKPKGKKKKKLNRKGKVKVTPAITFKPTSGEPRTQSIKVKLKRKLRKR